MAQALQIAVHRVLGPHKGPALVEAVVAVLAPLQPAFAQGVAEREGLGERAVGFLASPHGVEELSLQLQQLGLRRLEPEDPNVIVRPQLRDRVLHATGSPGAATLADAEKATVLRRSKYQAQRQHSGLLHEYNFYVHNRVGYAPGRATLFFLLMGALMLGEGALERLVAARAPRARAALAAVPSPLVALGLQLLALPAFGPCFMRSWLDSGMVEAVGEMVPHIEC